MFISDYLHWSYLILVYSVKLATLKREMFYSDQSTLEVFNPYVLLGTFSSTKGCC